MNEITRIHLAKVPYDIEVSAKKELEKYLKVLELYADDEELLNDIEIRITELLMERGVKENGVIATADVDAVRKKLGEPEDFADEDSKSETRGAAELAARPSRKLYRNVDGAVLGGVLGGMAKYLGINPLGVRLVFVVLLLLTGFFPVVLVYIILWVILPPARTAAEKLQMSGEPVTLEKIKILSEDGAAKMDNEYAETTRRVISTLVGVGFVVLAFMSLGATLSGGVALFNFQPGLLLAPSIPPIEYGPSWPYVVAYCLMVASGILLTSLFIVLAFAGFMQKFSKKFVFLVVGIVVAGLLSFGSAVGLVAYKQAYLSQEIDRNMETKTVQMPKDFMAARTLKMDFTSADVKYIVSDTPRVEYKAVAGTAAPTLTMDKEVALLSNPKSPYPDYSKAFTHITIYGPRLSVIETDSGKINYHGGTGSLSVNTKGWARVTLADGTFGGVNANIGDGGNLYAESAAVDSASLKLSGSGQYVQLGVVKSLAITYSEACASGSPSSVEVSAVVSGKLELNGESRQLQAIDSPCLSLVLPAKDE